VASGEKARRTHKMPRPACRVLNGGWLDAAFHASVWLFILKPPKGSSFAKAQKRSAPFSLYIYIHMRTQPENEKMSFGLTTRKWENVIWAKLAARSIRGRKKKIFAGHALIFIPCKNGPSCPIMPTAASVDYLIYLISYYTSCTFIYECLKYISTYKNLA
jgi:hypothetical protein